MSATLLRVPWAVVSSELEVKSDVEIAFEDGRILEVRESRRGAVDRELPGRVLIPGLLNAHVHSEYLLLKGLLEELRLSDWDHHALFQRAWTWVKAPEQLQALRAVYRASYLEMLLGGTTYVAEFNCSDESAAVCREEMAAVGVDGLQTRRVFSRQQTEGVAVELSLIHI